MFVLGPTDNGNTGGENPKRTVESMSVIKDRDFGGNREYSTTPRKSSDYKKPTLGAPNEKENPVEDTTKDIDDLNDPQTRKNLTSRQREKTDLTYRKDLVHEDSSYENRPLEDTDAFEPDPTDADFLAQKRRSKSKGHFGEGQYDNMPNRGVHEGEVS